MKTFCARIAIVTVVLLAAGAGAVHAATVAPGPYYATPSWDQQLPAATRFIVLSNWNSDAVLDRETGLVWHKTPFTAFVTWEVAMRTCPPATIGNRLGWRLPTVQELASLFDPAVLANPRLPAGHPFTVERTGFWSATTGQCGAEPCAWIVSFTFGLIDGAFPQTKGGEFSAWCVRSGSSGPETQ